MNEVIQYVLSARQRALGFTIEDLDENLIALCYKGKRFYTTHPFETVLKVQWEVEKYQCEFNIW